MIHSCSRCTLLHDSEYTAFYTLNNNTVCEKCVTVDEFALITAYHEASAQFLLDQHNREKNGK